MIITQETDCACPSCFHTNKLKKWRKAKGKHGEHYRCFNCGKLFSISDLEKELKWHEAVEDGEERAMRDEGF